MMDEELLEEIPLMLDRLTSIERSLHAERRRINDMVDILNALVKAFNRANIDNVSKGDIQQADC